MTNHNNFILGNISKVRWHTYFSKIAINTYGHMAETYDEENMMEEIIENRDSNGNITEIYPLIKLNEIMDIDKNYAMVSIDIEGNILVRNLFDSKHPKGFDQKNTYFADDIADKFMLSDTNNILLNYVKLDNPEYTDIKKIDHILYYCVEYELSEGVNLNFLNYCISLERKYNDINNKLHGFYNSLDCRLKIIEPETKNTKILNNNPITYFTNIKFPFF